MTPCPPVSDTTAGAAHAFLLRVAQASPVGMCYVQKGVIAYINPRLAALTGLRAGDAFAGALADAGDAGVLAGSLRAGGGAMERELAIRGVSGVIQTLVSAQAFDGETGAGALYWFVDISRQKQIELETMRAKDRAEEASRLKSNFLDRMSHEIRTPLNAILGMIHLLGQSGLSAQQRETSEKIRSACEELVGVINNILEFSVLRSGGVALASAPFSLTGLLAERLEPVRERAQSQGLEWNVRIADNVPDNLVGDAPRLGQLLLLLLDNAIKFTDAGAVSLGIAREPAEGESVDLHFQVRDTGIGMDAEQLEKVFQSFTQADGTLTRRHGGVGLGLSISQALARLMGGSLWAESSPGKGSVFHAVLPFAPGADASRPAVAPAKGRTERGRDMSELWTDAGGTGAKPRILLVEDNEINQEIAGELLRDLNVDVAFAEDGERAVAAVRAGRFDMIFMDIQMPVMDGLEATRQIRASGIDWACAVPIIAMTAHGMNEDRERSLAAGMSDHLTKPIDPEELRRAIARWLPENPVGAAVPAAEAESPVTRRLQGLYGVDVKSGLANVAGNEKLYLSLLNRFTVKYRGSPGELPALLKANDREGALRLVHTIKGVAANLGAHRLADLVKRIESAMLAKESVTSLLVPYARELARVAQGIERLSRELTAQEGGGVGEAVSPDHVPHILGALGTLPELLQTDWGQAQEKVESLGGLLAHTDAADIYSRLADALEEFDVPAFMAACQELIRHLRRA